MKQKTHKTMLSKSLAAAAGSTNNLSSTSKTKGPQQSNKPISLLVRRSLSGSGSPGLANASPKSQSHPDFLENLRQDEEVFKLISDCL